jgi:cytochrome c-type biogenesis protein CcmH/NrfG
MDSTVFANTVIWELRLIHWLLIAILLLLGLVVLVLISSHRGLGRQLSAIESQQQQARFQQRMEDLLTKGLATQVVFAATEAITSRPRDPQVHWYLGQANFQLKEYIKAKKAFSTVIEIAPNWTSTVDPWLERIEQEIRDAGPKVVK